MGNNKASYNAEFKLRVIIYTEENGKQATVQQFGADPKCVRM
jgi:hypothetical protein